MALPKSFFSIKRIHFILLPLTRLQSRAIVVSDYQGKSGQHRVTHRSIAGIPAMG